MARRRKNRTHNKGNATAKTSNGIAGDPKSFVIKHGSVGHSIAQLVRDMRKVMEPNTATRLRVSDNRSSQLFSNIYVGLGTITEQIKGLFSAGSDAGSNAYPSIFFNSKSTYNAYCALTCWT